MDRGQLDKYLPVVFQLLLRRLTAKSGSVKYVRFLTIFLSTFIVTHGVALFEQHLQQQQQG